MPALKILLITALIAALVACANNAKDDAPDPTPDPMPEATPDMNPEMMPDVMPEPEPPTGPLGGLYLVGLQLAPVGGLVRPFQIEIASSFGADGASTIEKFVVRAANDDFELSEPIGELTDIPVDGEGNFTAVFADQLILPGEFSPSGSEVIFEVTFEGQIDDPDFFCGEVTGELVTFEFDLEGSTFAGIPWDDRGPEYPSACEGGGPEEIPRIAAEDCPALLSGRNTFDSGGREDRQVAFFLPEDYTEDRAWPLAFVFHGFGGSIDRITRGAGFETLATELGIIIAVPEGLDEGGFFWEIITTENKDVAFFDDMVTCAQTSFSIDEARIHSTGMSNGGIFTGALTAARSGLLASVAPLSGGIFVPYPDDAAPRPALVVWGGEEDFAFDQDFNIAATEMIETFKANGQFVVGCDHGLGHTLEASFWPWVLRFFVDHPKGLGVEPYANGLPEIFPDYCSIR